MVAPKKPETPEIKIKPTIMSQQEKDQQPVRGLFRCHEIPGGIVSFNYRKYKGEPVRKYTLRDNSIETIPYGVATHINKNVKYPVHKYAIDKNNIPLQTIGTMKARCSFQSLEFMDIEDMREMGDEGNVLVP